MPQPFRTFTNVNLLERLILTDMAQEAGLQEKRVMRLATYLFGARGATEHLNSNGNAHPLREKVVLENGPPSAHHLQIRKWVKARKEKAKERIVEKAVVEEHVVDDSHRDVVEDVVKEVASRNGIKAAKVRREGNEKDRTATRDEIRQAQKERKVTKAIQKARNRQSWQQPNRLEMMRRLN